MEVEMVDNLARTDRISQRAQIKMAVFATHLMCWPTVILQSKASSAG
jgi:hypothetical protein